MHEWYYRSFTESKATMSNKEVVEELKNLLMSNDLSKQQENALIIAIAEFLKE